MQLLAVAIGGFFGAILRYLIGTLLISPISTFTVNLIGSFFLAWLLTFATEKKKLSKEVTIGIGTGLLGSFTTFSTFSVDTVQLFSSSVPLAILYVTGTIVLGLLFSYLGYKVARKERKSAR